MGVIPPSTSNNNTSDCKPTATTSSDRPDNLCDTENANHPKDINNYINRLSILSNADKYDLTNPWKPDSDYTFPPDKISGGRFQHDWFTRFPWLVYSVAVNGGFCINSALFELMIIPLCLNHPLYRN
jgi:hypothetical protein